MTGDVTAYLRAEPRRTRRSTAQPGYLPALAMRGSILVSLHRFPEARDLATVDPRRQPGDPTALGVLGDASLELGDLATATKAYARARHRRRRLRVARPLGAPRVRPGRPRRRRRRRSRGRRRRDRRRPRGRRARLLPRRPSARRCSRPATRPGRERRTRPALAVRPDLPAALVGLAQARRVRRPPDAAIAKLDTAIAAIPLPDSLARRADLLTLRGEAGRRPQGRGRRGHGRGDRAARRRGGQRLRPRHVALPVRPRPRARRAPSRWRSDELAVRPDVYGYDALAWALLNAGDAAGAQAPMQSALAAGTKDARLWYHAGLIALANGQSRGGRRRTSASARPRAGPGPGRPRQRATAALATIR